MRILKTAVSVALFASLLLLAVCCSGTDNASLSYDGRVFDISERSDLSLTLTSKKVGNDYELTVKGVGKPIDFKNKSLVPWNVLSKKVSSITVEEGVTGIGDYFFSSTNVKRVFLPSTVKEIGKNSFADNTVIYSYSDSEIDTGNEIYYYSETQPSVGNKYFYMENGEPTVWTVAPEEPISVLFIGNSFTFRQGTKENPMVPYFFKRIAENLGAKISVDAVVESSYTLAKFANENDAQGALVAEKLKSVQYDYIVLQEQSTAPLNSFGSFSSAVKSLLVKIGASLKNAKVYLYQTWGSPASLGSGYKTVAEMTAALDAAYGACAAENELPVTHVGNAFAYVYDHYKEIAIFADDERHQSSVGAYLSACCHVRSMLGLDVRRCTYYGDDGAFGESTAKLLQEVAYEYAK